MTCTMPPTNSMSKAGVREGINKAYRDAALMEDKAIGEEAGLLLPQSQNNSNAVQCTGELRTDPQPKGV